MGVNTVRDKNWTDGGETQNIGDKNWTDGGKHSTEEIKIGLMGVNTVQRR
jgi:hypothetical protein